MKPKKKSLFEPIAYVIALIVVVFFCLHGAVAYGETVAMVETGTIAENELLTTCLSLTLEKATYDSGNIYFNEFTKDWLMWGCFGWLIVVLMIENSKRNYIHGKEFGTSKWGTLADIKDLFASSIAQLEIKRAKAVSNPFKRRGIRKKIYKECERDGQAILKRRLESAKDREKERKADGTANKTLYNEEVKQIKEEVAETVELAKCEAWKPRQYKRDYLMRVDEIAENPLLNDLEKSQQKKEAKRLCKEQTKKYYNSKGKAEAIKKKYSNADMPLTESERVSFYNYKINQNILIIGGSGSGKTRGFVMPNILMGHSSYVVTDPKGEILEKAGHYLTDVEGYKIRVLNLDEKTLSDGYNPFVYVHPEREGYEERVLSLIETIIINTDGGEKKGGSDPFWDKAERLFLQAIFFFVTDGFIPEERNMNTVMKLIGMLEIGEEEDNMDSDLDHFARIFARKFGDDHIGVEQYREFRSKASGKTAKSIVISAVARLAPFRTKEVKRIFSYDTMELERLGEEKTAIFVVVPPTDTSFNFIAGMLFTQMFQELQYCATQVHKHEGQRLPVPVRFILDEFANTCTIPQFVKILAYARSFGIGIVPILQSLEQIKNMYKDEWGVIIDNCNSLLFLGSVTHMDTLEYISKLIGKGTFDKKTTGRTRGRQGSSSVNEDVVGRELMFADDIRKLPKEDCLLIIGGRNPFYSKKYNYEKHPNYRYTSDANRSYSYSYSPALPAKKEDVSHREKEVVEPYEAIDPSEVEVAVEEIKIVENPMEEMRILTEGYAKLVPLSDEFLRVNDGEELDFESYIKFFDEENAKDESAVADFAQKVIDEVLADVEKTLPSLIPFIEEVRLLGRTWRELSVLPDGFIGVNDGEMLSDDEIVGFEQIVFDDEEADGIGVSDTLGEDLESLLSDLLNESGGDIEEDLKFLMGDE